MRNWSSTPATPRRPSASIVSGSSGRDGKVSYFTTSYRGTSMYQAYGLIQQGSDFNLDTAVQRLQAKLPNMSAQRDGNQVSLYSDDWSVQLTLNADPSVLAESADMAEKIAGDVDGSDIAACRQRVEVWSEVPDPFMEHFSDFMAIIEVLQSFQGVIAVDPREPC